MGVGEGILDECGDGLRIGARSRPDRSSDACRGGKSRECCHYHLDRRGRAVGKVPRGGCWACPRDIQRGAAKEANSSPYWLDGRCNWGSDDVVFYPKVRLIFPFWHRAGKSMFRAAPSPRISCIMCTIRIGWLQLSGCAFSVEHWSVGRHTVPICAPCPSPFLPL